MTMRISRRLSLSALVVFAVLAVAVAPAAATVKHQKVGSFNGLGTPGGLFGPVLVSDAVDQSNGDVWVMEWNVLGGASRVDKFDENGTYAGVEITGVPSIPGQETFALGAGSGTAVDNSPGANKGDVYVADTEHGVVDRFNTEGKFLCQITAKTPVSATEIAHECNGAAGSATPDLTIKPAGVAVDANGDVYVADEGHEAIDKFSAAGAYISQIKDPHLTAEMRSVALDSAGNLYVWVEREGQRVVKFGPSGVFVAVFASTESGQVASQGQSQGVGVDPKTGHVYIDLAEEKGILEFEGSGTLLDVIPTPGESFLGGMAVNATTGRLYAAEVGGGSVAIFSGDIAFPTVTALPATSVTETSATLNGHLDPDAVHGGGEVSECEFEWGTTTAYGHTASCSPPGPYTSAADVSAPIGGLTRATTYHFRVKARNANGTNESADETLTTADAAVIDAQSSRVNGVAATLTAQINPYHFDTTCQVQYVDDASFQSSRYASATTLPCAPEDLGSGFGDVRAEVTLTGLKIGTTYHYRFLATNQAGLSGGADRTFITFGMHGASFEVIDEVGKPFTRAGGHPYELRTAFSINWSENVGGARLVGGDHPEEVPTGNLRNVINELPAGLIGNPSATPKCTRAEVIKFKCSGAAQVGRITINEAALSGSGFHGEYPAPIYNVVPPRGVAAEFDANILQHVTIHIDARLRSGGDYGVTAESATNTALTGISEVLVHFWGVPAEPSHDAERECPAPSGVGNYRPCSANEPQPKPFLRNPTSCAGPLTTVLAVDSYQAPGLFDEHTLPLAAITGCDKVPFTPRIEAAPSSDVADSPSGLSFDLHVSQPEEAQGVGESDVRNASVTFPMGLAINPSSADGLAACSEAQVGFTGFAELNKASEPGVRTPQFTPLPAQCPDASKLGSVTVKTPLLDHPLPGAIYIAKQGENPFGSLLAVYIAIYDPVTGVVVKLPGEVRADPQTGQLTTTVDQDPQVPFEDFEIKLFEGPRAALTTPATCGSFTTGSVLSPWSGGTPASPSSSFEVVSGAGGAACPTSMAQVPMAPSFSAGTFTPIAGSYSPLVLKVGREDGSQQLQSLNVTLPEGLLGKIAGVAQCPQAAIEAAQARGGLGEARPELEHPSCPSDSEIGTVNVGAGSGAPLYVGGRAYLAGPYESAPFSVVVITPATAGPFDLGTVVVRSALFIDPHTVRVTVKSDPFPTMLDGIPLDIRSISVQATRPGFTLNPTSCEKMAVVGTIASTQGAQANVSSPFQVGGCNNLPFKPSFTASTNGRASKADGASLTVQVNARPGDANVSKVEVQLPLQLPSRLTTLQKACTETQFNSNPAGCPVASRVATATVHTPLLNAPLSGPVYFVGHGGAAFPDLVMDLQSEGVMIMLVGHTEIKRGITYSRFESVPDAPFTSFELAAPQGPDSILAANVPASANHSLCGQTLSMPTTLTAQNGLVLNQKTKIQVTGCARAKGLTRIQLLARALRACRHRYGRAKLHRRREACERAAHGRYTAKRGRKK
jgi:NHL repeat